MLFKNKKIMITCCICILCIIIAAVSIFSYIDAADRADYLSDSCDTIFEINFSQLCTDMNLDVNQESYEKYYAHTYICFSLFSLTSYSNDVLLNRIILGLYNIVESKELSDIFNSELAAKLNRLSHNMRDSTLINEIYEIMYPSADDIIPLE